MKKKVAVVLSSIITILMSLSTFGAEGIVKDGRTLVGVRGVFEELGFNVKWDAERNEATLSDGSHYISLIKGEEYFSADGMGIKPDVPQQIIDGKFYLPLRAIGDAIGADVSWNEANKMAHISYNGKDVYIKCAITQTSNSAHSKNTGDSIIPGVRAYVYDDIKKLFFEEEDKYSLDYIVSIAGNESELEKFEQVSKANQRKMEEYLNSAKDETEKEFVLYAGAMLIDYQVAVLETAQVCVIYEAYGIDDREFKEAVSGILDYMKINHKLYFSSTDKTKRESYYMDAKDIYKEIDSLSQKTLSHFK